MWQQTDSSSSSLFYHEQGNRLFDWGGGGWGALCCEMADRILPWH